MYVYIYTYVFRAYVFHVVICCNRLFYSMMFRLIFPILSCTFSEFSTLDSALTVAPHGESRLATGTNNQHPGLTTNNQLSGCFRCFRCCIMLYIYISNTLISALWIFTTVRSFWTVHCCSRFGFVWNRNRALQSPNKIPSSIVKLAGQRNLILAKLVHFTVDSTRLKY